MTAKLWAVVAIDHEGNPATSYPIGDWALTRTEAEVVASRMERWELRRSNPPQYRYQVYEMIPVPKELSNDLQAVSKQQDTPQVQGGKLVRLPAPGSAA